MGFDIFAQGGVDTTLVAPSGLLEKPEHVGIEAEGDLLFVFDGHERAGSSPRHPFLGWNVAVVDFMVGHFSEGGFLLRRKPDRAFRVGTAPNDSSMLVFHGCLPFSQK